ncbi:MAG: transcriptional repressor LexA [Deltaproteobacteria bacterium]|nr:transcriptional repressor LexA [Deltaproteobacteria bacterium]
MLLRLTDRQKLIYDFLVRTVREKGYAPSIQEIGSRFRIASTNGVFRHLKALEKKGYIRRVGKRALEIVSAQGRSVLSDVREVPVLGRVPAGKPLLAEENIEGYLPVARELAPGKEVFVLKLKGDSMIEEGIRDGDYVIIRRQETAENGDIVCALIDGEATLKKFYKKGNAITLRPANKSYRPIVVSQKERSGFRILGKAIGLTRKL